MFRRPRGKFVDVVEMRLGRRLAVISVCWLLLVAVGMAGLQTYANRPGTRGNVPPHWPTGHGLGPQQARSTLLVFAHPRCPCTHATLDELAWIIARCDEGLDCRIVFVQPAGRSPNWVRDALWAKAAALPGVTLCVDREGRAAQRFGAHTSGHVVLYDAEGNLRYEGGVTPARGHRGGNRGRSRVAALLAGEPRSDRGASPSSASTSVFGCPLFSSPQRSSSAEVR
jgi:hypothetical protein